MLRLKIVALKQAHKTVGDTHENFNFKFKKSSNERNIQHECDSHCDHNHFIQDDISSKKI